MTVCKIGRNDAENRIRSLLSINALPANGGASPSTDVSNDSVEEVNLEEVLRDAIRSHIARKFAGHGLAELVEAILKAQGYKTFLSPPGPDGGVDVLAGLGPHGFDGTKLAVQVKSGGIQIDTGMLREFRAVMGDFGAKNGLIVSWGGFRPPVMREIPKEFFNVRMWGEDELIDAVLTNYDALPASIQTRLPLKRTWMLVVGGEDN